MSYQSVIYSKYLSNEKMSAIVSDEALIEKMLRFESTLARAQEKLGMIPAAAADEIVNVISEIKIKPEDLAQGTLQNGVPVIPLLSIVKEALSPETKKHLHYGATSQDTLDTAQILIAIGGIEHLTSLCAELTRSLKSLSSRYGSTKCMARTRGQLAAPITFGARIDSWYEPLQRLQHSGKDVASRLSKVQLGGAVGDLSSFKSNGKGLVDEVAYQLGLASATSWQVQRDSLAEFTNWLAMLCAIGGKMGADILVMSQNEIAEVEELGEGGGKSSSMPHKNNPVLSEALVAIAKLNASLQARMLQGMVHAGERDGTAWILEWETVRQMMIYTATSLSHAIQISAGMKVHTDVMERNVAAFLERKGK